MFSGDPTLHPRAKLAQRWETKQDHPWAAQQKDWARGARYGDAAAIFCRFIGRNDSVGTDDSENHTLWFDQRLGSGAAFSPSRLVRVSPVQFESFALSVRMDGGVAPVLLTVPEFMILKHLRLKKHYCTSQRPSKSCFRCVRAARPSIPLIFHVKLLLQSSKITDKAMDWETFMSALIF